MIASQEKYLGNVAVPELLAMLGVFGALISGLQALVLERQALLAADWNWENAGLFVGFAMSMYLFYVLVPFVLIWSSATALNVSLLTADLYSAIARSALFGGFGGRVAIFVVCFLVIAAGIITFAAGGETATRDGAAKSGIAAAAASEAQAADAGHETREEDMEVQSLLQHVRGR